MRAEGHRQSFKKSYHWRTFLSDRKTLLNFHLIGVWVRQALIAEYHHIFCQIQMLDKPLVAMEKEVRPEMTMKLYLNTSLQQSILLLPLE